jgi:predicted DNA-binding protein
MKISLEPKGSTKQVAFRLKRPAYEALEQLAKKSKTTTTNVARVIIEEALANGVEVEPAR